MGIVFGLSQHITVLDQGRVLAEGAPAEISANERVRAAYLGEEAA
jgi:branched-chain amino acid transport system ATP-binding protein